MRAITIIESFCLDIDIQDIAYLFSEERDLCFLDSSLVPDKFSKFSYISWDPTSRLRSYGYHNRLENVSDGVSIDIYQHPLRFLKDYVAMTTFRWEDEDHKKISLGQGSLEEDIEAVPDFLGGLMGYLSYDLKGYIEKLPDTVDDDINMPVIGFNYYDWTIAFSHSQEKYYYIKNFFYSVASEKAFLSALIDKDKVIDEKNTEKALEKARDIFGYLIEEKIGEIRKRAEKSGLRSKNTIKSEIRKRYLERKIEGIELRSNFMEKDYIKAIKNAKRYIHQGDIYQINMTQRFNLKKHIEAIDLYYILREKNPAPFSAFLDFKDIKIGSSSPERFLFLKGDTVETRPIKGTRPRGRDETEDRLLMEELIASKKDRAELNMIVDLERNDLGKFCDYGTVEVIEHAVIEKYAKVFHSVSTIRGTVREGYDISDIIKATFPGGSITGAPKIRAMQIIDELETKARNVYTGSIGYISIDNTMDLNIVIRTFIIKGDDFFYNVGGGIVEDSVPKDEYEETLDKGLALKDSLEFFEYDNLIKDKD